MCKINQTGIFMDFKVSIYYEFGIHEFFLPLFNMAKTRELVVDIKS